MSKRKWVERPAFIALSAVLIVVAYMVGLWQEGQTHRREQADRQTRYHAQYAEETVRASCAGLEGDALAECAADAVSASYENQRAEYDLIAQESMARWAFWLLVLSTGSLGITFLGVYYVWLTLKETAAGVLTMRNEQRPWVLFSHVEAHYIKEPPDGLGECIEFKLLFKNFGGSPAVGTGVNYRPDIQGLGGVYARFGLAPPRDREVVPPGMWLPVGPYVLRGADIANFWDREAEVAFDVLVRYFSPDRNIEATARYFIRCECQGQEENKDGDEFRLILRVTTDWAPEVT